MCINLMDINLVSFILIFFMSESKIQSAWIFDLQEVFIDNWYCIWKFNASI